MSEFETAQGQLQDSMCWACSGEGEVQVFSGPVHYTGHLGHWLRADTCVACKGTGFKDGISRKLVIDIG
jgi:hypothetical protein